jgi:hypothetical protein
MYKYVYDINTMQEITITEITRQALA